MHIDIVPNRNSAPAVLLRESFREGGKVRKRTLGNLSALSSEQIDAIRKTLKGEKLVPVTDLFEILRSAHHGHVQAVQVAMKRLGFESLVASRPCRDESTTHFADRARCRQSPAEFDHRRLSAIRDLDRELGSSTTRSPCRSTSAAESVPPPRCHPDSAHATTANRSDQIESAPLSRGLRQ